MENNKLLKQSNFLTDFLLAGISASIGKTATAPLERVKLLLQNQIVLKAVISEPYKGLTDCLFRISKSEGILSLWRGNFTNVMRYFPNQAMNFALKDSLKKIFSKHDPHKNFFKFLIGNCISGGTAGSISLLVLHPFDLVRTKLATDNKNNSGNRKYKGAFDCINKVYKNDGVKGLYSGIMISIVGIFAYRAIYFGGYDTFKFLYGHRKLEKQLQSNTTIKIKETRFDHLKDFLAKWFIAQSVTVIAGLCFYPLDTVRRRIMLTKQINQPNKNIIVYKNSFDCIKQIKVNEGFKGFYKGFGANVLKTMGSSIILVLYDELQKLLGLSARNSVTE